MTLRIGGCATTRFSAAPRAVGVLAALALSVPGSADAAGIGTKVFTTSGEQSFTVPPAVTSVQATLVGGNGGNGQDGGSGGIPATATATLAVTPGQTLYAEVAGNGTNGGISGGSAGGYGGGGNAGAAIPLLFATPGGGGGGGASDVRTCSAGASGGCSGVASLATRLVVAGGGGGGGGGGDEDNAAGSILGGNGGSADQPGSVGQQDTAHDTPGSGAGQGTATGGGATGSAYYAGASGTLGLGGTGGGGTEVSGGGGGGGGIYGGGGGGGGKYSTSSSMVYASGAGGGGGGASGVPAAARGVSGFSLVPTATGAQPTVTFTWALPAPTAITGAVTGITTTTATVSGTVNPNAYQLTSCYFQVSPAPSGGATFPCAQQIPVASSPVPVSATLAGLSPDTSYTVTLISANAQGTANGSAAPFRTIGSATGVGTSPVVSGLKLKPTRFQPGKQMTKLGTAGKTGTTISFTLSTAASIKLTFARVLPKRAAHRECGTAVPALRSGSRCAHLAAAIEVVNLNVPAGHVKLRFEGVLNGGHRLKAGAYVLTLIARTKSGHASVARHTRFTLLR